MFITQGFGYVALFNGWWFLVPVIVCIIAFCLMNTEEKLRGRSFKDDEIGITGGLGVASIMIFLLGGLFYILLGWSTHTSMIEKDFEEQFSITYVDFKWDVDGEQGITGKDSEGRYVICRLEDTKSEDTFKVNCDNNKDNWKGIT